MNVCLLLILTTFPAAAVPVLTVPPLDSRPNSCNKILIDFTGTGDPLASVPRPAFEREAEIPTIFAYVAYVAGFTPAETAQLTGVLGAGPVGEPMTALLVCGAGGGVGVSAEGSSMTNLRRCRVSLDAVNVPTASPCLKLVRTVGQSSDKRDPPRSAHVIKRGADKTHVARRFGQNPHRNSFGFQGGETHKLGSRHCYGGLDNELSSGDHGRDYNTRNSNRQTVDSLNRPLGRWRRLALVGSAAFVGGSA